jgi:hypothetical protein
METNKKQQNFITKAKKVHGDKYDYSQAEYTKPHVKVKIICKEHGVFLQTPSAHLRGQQCRFCSYGSMTTKQFIEKAKKVHGDKYDYSQTKYANLNKKVSITCKEHGSFNMISSNHLKGGGCPFCGRRKKLTTESFTEKAQKVHGDKYDYSQVEYTNNVSKVKIICKEHGAFEQIASNHLTGHGCPACGRRRKQ